MGFGSGMEGGFMFFYLLWLVVSVVIAVYVLTLLGRFVRAVEKIADKFNLH